MHQSIQSKLILAVTPFLFLCSGQEETQSLAGQSGSDNTAHLKGKLNSLMELARSLHEQLNTHKKEV